MIRRGKSTWLLMMVLLIPLAGCWPVSTSLLPPGEEIIEHGTPTDTLTCSTPAAVARVDTVIRPGNAAVTLRAGGTTLSLKDSAFSGERRIVLQQNSGQAFNTAIDGETGRTPPPRMRKSATLTFDTSRCTAEELEQADDWYVWRLNPTPGLSQKLRTHDNSGSSREIWTVIDSTSTFMIAN